ncbi:MAG: substrate-binding domain-containing protein [Bacteroidota bacterium]|nr:substrate-binding domain-containing protein [Bacteroidota bacterium]MDP4274489.1 substrate-binding domain-containing protein [Bacteroidota bacterium]
MGKLRIKDIALKVGVSVGTVDRVLHNRGEVAEETRQKVLKIVEEEGYVPNLLARRLASKKKFCFATLLPSYQNDNDYWKYPQVGVLKAQKELEDFGVIIQQFYFDQFNEKTFENQARELIKLSPDAILIAPVFAQKCMQLIDKCNIKGIPYVFIDSNIYASNRLSYIGQNAVQSGLLAGRLMSYSIESQSTILIITIAKNSVSTDHTTKRVKGFKDFFSSPLMKKKVNILDIDVEEDVDILLYKALVEAFDKNKNIQGIFVTNSKAYKVARFLEKNHLDKVHLIGYDLVKDNIFFLEKNIIDFLISQRPEVQGYNAVMTLYNYLILKKEVKMVNHTPIDIITKENLKYYLNLEL